MDINEAIKSERPESTTLEYKSTDEHIDGILKEIVALANNQGGSILIGIREDDGEIVDIENVSDPAGLEEALQSKLGSSVEPRLDVEFQEHQYDGKCIIEISVPAYDLLRSVNLNKPVFPIRQGSTTTYLHGLNLARAYSGEGPDLTPTQSSLDGSEPNRDPSTVLKEASTSVKSDQALLLLHYTETDENRDGITVDELSELFRRGRVSVPSTPESIIDRLEGSGHIMEIDGDPSRWALTTEGVERAEALSSSTAKSRSLSEYYRTADNPTKRDSALIVGWYLEHEEEKSDFTRQEVAQRAKDAKISLGANVSRDLSSQVHDGQLMKTGEREGQDTYQLTLTGEEYVEEELLELS